jgi:hypothetical protein
VLYPRPQSAFLFFIGILIWLSLRKERLTPDRA